jgi:hypothetical protein
MTPLVTHPIIRTEGLDPSVFLILLQQEWGIVDICLLNTVE